jgi:hypothetical protein
VEQHETGNAGGLSLANRLAEAALGVGPRRTTPQTEEGIAAGANAEGDPVEYTMELILMSTAGTTTLLLLQLMDFLLPEQVAKLASRIEAIPGLLPDRGTLTLTVPVVAAFRR